MWPNSIQYFIYRLTMENAILSYHEANDRNIVAINPWKYFIKCK
jgi:hypothetical protein